MLTGPTVAGLRARTTADGQFVTVPGRWEPLVDRDTWDRAQVLLGQPRMVTGADGEQYRVRSPRPRSPRRYLLSGGTRAGETYGVLRCGKCDVPMVAQTQARPGGGRVPAYACHPKSGDPKACGGVSISPADAVEEAVVAAMKARLAANDALRGRLNATQDADAAHWRAKRDAAKGRLLDFDQLLGAGRHRQGSLEGDDPRRQGRLRRRQRAPRRCYERSVAALRRGRDRAVGDAHPRSAAGSRRASVERIEVAPGSAGRPGFNEDRLGDPDWRALQPAVGDIRAELLGAGERHDRYPKWASQANPARRSVVRRFPRPRR